MTPPILTASDLRRFAQYLLAASVALQNNRLDENAAGLLAEWTRASGYLEKLLGEHDGSLAAHATKRAIGHMTRGGLAQADAAHELRALLDQSDALKNDLADANWSDAADQMASAVVHAFCQSLERGQS